jgi:hypothetical protein
VQLFLARWCLRGDTHCKPSAAQNEAGVIVVFTLIGIGLALFLYGWVQTRRGKNVIPDWIWSLLR